MGQENFYLTELIMHLNLAFLFEERPYLLKRQLNHGFQGRLCKYLENKKSIIHFFDKIKCPINFTHDLDILSQIELGKQK